MNELKNRGVGDILVANVDGLKGFPEAITARTWRPQCKIAMLVSSVPLSLTID